MKKNQIEVEIKSLIGNIEAMESLISRMREKYSKFTLKKRSKQLNHYFIKGNLKKLANNLSRYLSDEQNNLLENIVIHGKNHSVRTRKADNNVLVVIKATLDETSSSNGIARSEFEAKMDSLSLEELDELILSSDFEYQAKWSRERQEYQYKDYSVSIDKNAGYGYLAEFERIISPDDDFNIVKGEIRRELSELQIEELSQERLERMFEHYNENWSDYYGTDKTFTIF